MDLTPEQERAVAYWVLEITTEDYEPLWGVTGIIAAFLERAEVRCTLDDAIALAQRFVDQWHEWRLIAFEKLEYAPCGHYGHIGWISHTEQPRSAILAQLRDRDNWIPRQQPRAQEVGVGGIENAHEIYMDQFAPWPDGKPGGDSP